MARSVLALVVLIAVSAIGGALAEPSPSPSPVANAPEKDASKKDSSRKDGSKKDGSRKDGPRDDDEGALKRFREKLEQMSPKEREQFKQNWQRWKEMGDRERKDWQQRASEDRERLRKCVDDAIAKMGLTLDKDQREVFEVRYRQERRKIEEQLRQELDAKRQSKVDDMLARLKAEFSPAKASPSPVDAPVPAPTP